MAKLTADQIYGYAVGAGFSPDEAVTMTAIALAESGGNTTAHNPNGEDSRGLWQVNMRAHSGWVGNKNLYDPAVAAWAAKKVYDNAGGSISPWTVTHGTNNYPYKKYEAAAQQAAADAGYEGMVGNFSGVANYKGKASAGSPEGAVASGGSTDTRDVDTIIREDYGDFSFLMDDPEVAAILREAASLGGEGLDDAAFMSRIRATKWYQTNGSTARQWETTLGTDPASAQRALAAKKAELRQRANQLGVQASDEELAKLADRALRFNLNDAEMSVAFGELMADDTVAAGAVASTMTQLRAMARQYVTKVDENELTRWAKGIAVGTATSDDFGEALRTLAKAKFSGNDQVVKMIDQGMSPEAFFADHKSLLASEWDMSPEQIDLTDSRWQNSLQIADGDSIRPMTLDEMRKYTRSQDGWDKTTTGRKKISETATMLLEKFGKVAY